MKTLLWLAIAGAIIGWGLVALQVADYRNSSPMQQYFYNPKAWPLLMAVACSVILGSLL